MNFSAWSIHRPLPAILLFVLLTAVGLYSFKKLPITDFADLEFPYVTISIGYNGATPTQIEAEITRKVEDAVAGVDGVQHITSTISQGSSLTTIEFALDSDIQVALEDVRDAVSRIRSALPQDIIEPVVSRFTVASQPVATYAIASDTIGEAELSWLVDDSISKLILAVPGVGTVKRLGGVEREIRVDLKSDRLLAFGITAGQVSQQLRSTQGEQAGGVIKLSNGEQNIRVLASVDSPEALRNFPIALSDGRNLRLEELGSVEDRYADRTALTLLDGKPVVGFQIQRRQGSNELELDQEVAAALETFRADHPTVKLTLVSSNSPRIRSTFDSSMHMLYEGAALAVAVVFLFLRDWRATWISATALPLSVIPTFFAMLLFGVGLNNLSLLALSLVVGLLVDDAIVEVENIVRHLREGKSPRQAALDAAQEIGLAVIGTSLTLVAIFVPVAFMPGIPGKFFKQFAITCTVAVVFSLLVARLITPMLAAYRLKALPEEHHHPIYDRYLALVRWTLRHRGITLLAALGIFVLSIAVYATLPTSFLSADDRGELSVNVSLPPGADLEATRATVLKVQDILLTQPEVAHAFSNIGTNTATITVALTPHDQRKRSQQQIQNALSPQLVNVSGARVTFGGFGFGQNLSVVLQGDDANKLADTAARVEREIRTIAGIVGASSSAALLKPEIAIRPDFSKLAQLGVTSAALSEAIRIGTTGDIAVRLPKLNLPARQVPIRVQLDPQALKSIDALRLLRVPSRNGSVALASVADIEYSSGPAQISRYDRHRNVTISIPLEGRALGTVAAQIFALPALKQLPVGVEQQRSGDLERQRELTQGFSIAMLTGVFCVYAVLALLFNDLLQPITILLALPLSIGGAVAALAIFGFSLQVSSYIGILMLMGIAVKNSILLVDYTVLGEQRGMDRHDALLDACAKRARPIVMTSIAMGAGMLPTAINFGQGSGFRAPMGTAVLGGLFTSTVLSLVVIPAAYTYIADFEAWVRRVWHRAL